MKPVHIVLRPSVELGLALIVLYLSAAGVLIGLAIPVWLKGIVCIGLAWDLFSKLARVAFLQCPTAIVAILITHDGKILASSRNGSWLECVILRTSFVSSRLTVLNMKTRGSPGVRHVILCSQNVDQDEFRRIRTWLKWGHHDWRSVPSALPG